MITFQKVTKIYNTKTVALDDVSFHVNRGEFASIIGRSGAGKTTLLKLLTAEERPTRGRVLFEEYNVHKIKDSSLYRHRRCIGTIFQDYKLLPSKTVYENIAYVMEVMGADNSDIERDIPQVLDIVGLLDKKENSPRELSGGEKQRVAIARALIHRPQLIIADEPAGNLDPYHTREIIHLLLKINQMGTTVLLSTHDKEIINSLGARVLTLEEGKLIRDEERGRFML